MTRLAFPFRPLASGRSAVVREGDAEHVRNMLELLILTVPGERVMRPALGSAARELLFGAGAGPAALAVQATLAAAIGQHLGDDLDLLDLDVRFDEASATLAITVDYRLRATLARGRLTLERRA